MKFEVGSRVRLSNNIAVEGSSFANAGIEEGAEGTITINDGELPELGRAIMSLASGLEVPQGTEMTYVSFDGVEDPDYTDTPAEGKQGWSVPSFAPELVAAPVAA